MKPKFRISTSSLALVLIVLTLKSFAQDTNSMYDKLEMPSFEYNNLQIFLITSHDEKINKNYITLGDAMEKGLVELKETGNVEELSVKNKSDNHVLINSGDIVKGGKQDRTVRYDIILPPNSGDIPLASFCVESGRWEKRGDEEVNKFSSNTKFVSSTDLKLAVKYKKDQSSVWSSVSDQQEKINTNVGMLKGEPVNVTNNQSASSLQLTLENDDLGNLILKYKNSFSDLLKSNKKAIGFAYAINGKIQGIDIYNNRNLFENLWHKHLDAVITEAISELDKEKVNSLVSAQDAVELITDLNIAETNSENINNDTKFITYKKDNKFLFETIDRKENKWIHRSYIISHK